MIKGLLEEADQSSILRPGCIGAMRIQLRLEH